MTTRRTYTTAELRALASGSSSKRHADATHAALLYCADFIEAAVKVIEQQRNIIREFKETP